MPESPLVSVHLFAVPAWRVPAAIAHMALDRGLLRRTPGLRFAKLLGTGDGRTFTLRDADLRRWGLLAVWDRPAALDAFERSSPVATGWARIAEERWRAELRPLRARGRWSGRAPFGNPVGGGEGGAIVAALTRARLRPSLAVRFWRSVPAVAAEASAAPGLRFAIGVGEAPVGLQGTFSLWDDAGALAAFAYGGPAHLAAVGETRRTGWYAEELFARFAVLATTGTVGGVDPADG